MHRNTRFSWEHTTLTWQKSFSLLDVELLITDQKSFKLSIKTPSKSQFVLCMTKNSSLEFYLCLSLSETSGHYSAGHHGKGLVLHLA